MRQPDWPTLLDFVVHELLRSPATYLCLASLNVALTTRAQTFFLDSAAVSSGGGTSAGGIYSLSGTVGQPAPGAMTGGNYAFLGGFWSFGEGVETSGEPFLSAWLAGPNTVVIAWPNNASGFELEQSSTPAGEGWIKVAATPSVVGSEKQLAVPANAGQTFYRLRRP